MSTQFKYRAVTAEGQQRDGVVTATGPKQVVDMLEKMRLTPIRVTPVKDRPTFWLFGFLKRTDYEQLIIFTSSLSTMNKAGIPLLRALSLIRVGRPDSRFNHVIDQLRVSVQSGKALSEAMRDYPEYFSPVYVSGIAAGEESGQLEHTLDELADMLETEMQITRQVKSAVRYPFIVVGVICIAIVVLMTLVIPRFTAFYTTFGAELPLPTRIIMAVSRFSVHYWPLVLVGLVGLVAGFRRY
ncbi:MAG: type II secretion system F family protein, partial [Candidatus Zixiibacteriota bacterium]